MNSSVNVRSVPSSPSSDLHYLLTRRFYAQAGPRWFPEELYCFQALSYSTAVSMLASLIFLEPASDYTTAQTLSVAITHIIKLSLFGSCPQPFIKCHPKRTLSPRLLPLPTLTPKPHRFSHSSQSKLLLLILKHNLLFHALYL